MKYRILVTGGAGFIGSFVVDELVNLGHEVRVVDNLSTGKKEYLNGDAKLVEGDLAEKEICKKAIADIDIVYHLAAHASELESIFSPVMNAKSNYMGSLQLITECLNSDIKKIVYVGSAASYGRQENQPIMEGAAKNPGDPYAIGKFAIARILESYREIFGLDYITLLPHNVYGPRLSLDDPCRNVIGIFINRIMQGKPPVIYGDGNQKRSFLYIKDCAPYIAKAGLLDSPASREINLSSNEEISIRNLAGMILRLMDSKLSPVFSDKRPIELSRLFCSADNARKILDFRQETLLEEGLKETISWASKTGPREFKHPTFEISNKISGIFSSK